MKLPSIRTSYLIGLFVIIVTLSYAAYLQYVVGLEPCPLCILQRLTMLVLGIFLFFGAFFNLKKYARYFIGAGSVLVALTGAGLAGRQVWMQYVPSNEAGDCGVSLNYMLDTFPFVEVMKKIFHTGVDCALVDWTFLHLSLAVWSLILFVIFLIFTIWQCCRLFNVVHETN